VGDGQAADIQREAHLGGAIHSKGAMILSQVLAGARADRGPTGREGVIIPAANVRSLMLREAVVEAVPRGQFHVHAVASVDEAMELDFARLRVTSAGTGARRNRSRGASRGTA
jgi:predicted ATP-dependent protease